MRITSLTKFPPNSSPDSRRKSRPQARIRPISPRQPHPPLESHALPIVSVTRFWGREIPVFAGGSATIASSVRARRAWSNAIKNASPARSWTASTSTWTCAECPSKSWPHSRAASGPKSSARAWKPRARSSTNASPTWARPTCSSTATWARPRCRNSATSTQQARISCARR